MLVSNASLTRIASLLGAVLWILLLSFLVPTIQETGPDALGFSWHDFLIATGDPMYPFNIQTLMWLAFFYCLGELIIRWSNMNEQQLVLDCFDLYKDPNTITLGKGIDAQLIEIHPDLGLKPEIVSAIYAAKKKALSPNSLVLCFLRNITFQFHSTNDVGDVYNSVNSLMESELHKVDLSYTVIRYLAWLIPTLGFIGTVIGIAVALGKAGLLEAGDPDMLQKVIPLLATAFYTTLLALLLSAVVMILLQLIQAKDEIMINKISGYFMEKIVTSLKPRS